MWKEEKALTVEELRQMAGQPVWCPEEKFVRNHNVR